MLCNQNTAHCCAIKHLHGTLFVPCFSAAPNGNGLNTAAARPKLTKNGMLPLKEFPALSPSSAPRTAAATSHIRLQKYSGVKPNSQYKTSFPMTQFCNSAQHYQGTAADLSVP